MHQDAAKTRDVGSANRVVRGQTREPLLAQIASFVDLFVWLLLLKYFFLPLFIIPTGSMAETLAGAHGNVTCPNCGYEYQVGFHDPRGPLEVTCPNCRWQLPTQRGAPEGIRIAQKAGDRIVVHGWPYDFGGVFRPQRWDVVVFKNPNQPSENYIKRLIGLPSETIEIIDGDIWVDERIARKTRHSQEALWFNFYDHDYRPTRPSRYQLHPQGTIREYHPRWIALERESKWADLDQRRVRFDGLGAEPQSIQFVTNPGDSVLPAVVTDFYGYNAYHTPQRPRPPESVVTDVRVSCTVEPGDYGPAGYVELSIGKYFHQFFARLHQDGRLTLEHVNRNGGQRETWASGQVASMSRPVHLSLGHADYQVTVAVDGRPVLESDAQQYAVSIDQARATRANLQPPPVRIIAADARVAISHLKVDRDVHYTAASMEVQRPSTGERFHIPGNGVEGRPIKLGPAEYFVLGDNSPASLDGRLWTAEDLGPHLRAALERGKYTVGTVPADQMIGRAFLVYWPGFLPLTSSGPTLLPDLGRVRWIY